MITKTEEFEKTAPSKIFFWEGLFDPEDLAKDYDHIVKKLMDCNYQGLALEKLDGYNVYSVRLNRCDRLLFTTIFVTDKPYLLLLDEVLNHDYGKSRFLKRGVLKNYLELNGKIFSEEIKSAHFKVTDKPPVAPTVNRKLNKSLHYSRIDFFNQKFIELDPLQSGIVTKTKLPHIVKGAAGSGKSCVALSIISHYVLNLGEDKFPILYVTESEQLANHMRLVWQSLPLAQGLNANDVQFKNYEQLIKELEPKTATMNFVSKDHCLEWLEGYIKLRQKLAKMQGDALRNEFYADLNKIYQELRIISGCKSFDEYKNLGQKNSLFTNEQEQDWLYKAYAVYQKKLENSSTIYAPFYNLAKHNLYKRIAVDEAQDFSYLQLKALAELAYNKQICYCEDNRQSLSDNKSKVPFIEKLFYDWDLDINHTDLTVSYRCPAAAITMANATAKLKAIATDYGQADIQIPPGQAQGKVKWFDYLDNSRLLKLQQLALSPDFAIVTSKEYKDEAKKLFNTVLVFTPEEIKGLEYKNILAYRLLDNPLFKEADKVISEKSLGFSKKSDNRAKKDQAKEHLGPPFNAFYTACTRTTDTLYVFQEDHHKLKNIITHLKNAISPEQKESLETTPFPILNTEKLSAERFEHLKVLLGQGHLEMAREFNMGFLGKSAEEFEQLEREFTQPVEQPFIAEDKYGSKITTLEKSTKDQFSHTNNPLEAVDKRKKEASAPVISPEDSCLLQNEKTKKSGTLKKFSAQQAKQIIKPEISKKTEMPIEIKKLLRNVNKTTLAKFLKNSRAKEYLFDIPIKNPLNEACLFNTLFYDDYKIKALYHCMRMPEFQKLFIEIPRSALCEPKGKYLCSSFINGNNAFNQELQSKSIWINERAHTSPLYWLVSNEEGREIFKTLLKENPRLAKCVDPEALTRMRTSASQLDDGPSPLGLLLAQEKLGDEDSVLELLSKNNPRLAKVIAPYLKSKLLTLPEEEAISEQELSSRADAESRLKMLSSEKRKTFSNLLGNKDVDALSEFLKENQQLIEPEKKSEVKLLSSPSSLGMFSEKAVTSSDSSTKTESSISNSGP
ncbi:MAG: AAA family ATPase [Tatlockia sp.]|nr:AAA family ATPase [Tatlockia sp.]